MGSDHRIPKKNYKYSLKEIREKLLKDPKFVNSKRFDFDINKVLERYPDGCPDHVLASLLQLEIDDLEELHEEIISKLRREMGVE